MSATRNHAAQCRANELDFCFGRPAKKMLTLRNLVCNLWRGLILARTLGQFIIGYGREYQCTACVGRTFEIKLKALTMVQFV